MVKRSILMIGLWLGVSGMELKGNPYYSADTLLSDRSGRWSLSSARALWLRSANSAGIGLDTALSVASASVLSHLESGAFHRPQQPSSAKVWGIDAVRYTSIRKFSFYGDFRFRQKWEDNIRWSDLLDPYRGTPYVVADSLGGNWKKQQFSLSAGVATNSLFHERLHFGLSVGYEVETGARQNDPRPLNYAKNLKLSPGVIWNPAPGIRTGLSFKAGFFEEEVSMENRLATAQRQYKLKGLSIHDAPTIFSLSVTRTYSGRDLSGEWQLEKQFRGSRLMSSLSYGRYAEDTRDGVTKPTLGGRFENTAWRLSVTWQKERSSGYDELSLNVLQENGSGREYHQVYDPNTTLWVTTFEGIFYRSEQAKAGVAWARTALAPGGQTVGWRLGVLAGMRTGQNRYLYNQVSSQELVSAEAGLQAEKLLFNGRRKTVRAFLSGLYSMNIREDLAYAPRGTNARAAGELLYPDHAYLSSDAASVSASLRYTFYLKAYARTQFYLAGTGRYVRGLPSSETYYPAASRNYGQLTFGIFY